MSSAKRKDLGKLNLKNKFHKKIISLRSLTYSFKPRYFHLLNDYYFKMQCNIRFKNFRIETYKINVVFEIN